MSRIESSIWRTRGGEKARFTRLRWRVWAGGSAPSSTGTRPPIRLLARRPRISSDSSDSSASSRPSSTTACGPVGIFEQNVSGSRTTWMMSR